MSGKGVVIILGVIALTLCFWTDESDQSHSHGCSLFDRECGRQWHIRVRRMTEQGKKLSLEARARRRREQKTEEIQPVMTANSEPTDQSAMSANIHQSADVAVSEDMADFGLMQEDDELGLVYVAPDGTKHRRSRRILNKQFSRGMLFLGKK